MKKYEVRYMSQMVGAMALYGEYNSLNEAKQAMGEFRQTVADSSLQNNDRAHLLKSIEIR